MITELMMQKKYSIYRLSKNSGVPYTTVNDICSGKAQLEKCSGETIYKLAKELGVSMETLLEPCINKRSAFELFKSQICHRVKELGDIGFMIETLEKDEIRSYYNRGWYRESFYLLAMLDYLSRLNDIPLCTNYDDIRSCKLEEPLYPSGVLVMCAAAKNDLAKEQAMQDAIPEFLHFNILESEVRGVV